MLVDVVVLATLTVSCLVKCYLLLLVEQEYTQPGTNTLLTIQRVTNRTMMVEQTTCNDTINKQITSNSMKQFKHSERSRQ